MYAPMTYMNGSTHISVKAKSQPGNIRVKYNDNTKRPKPKENQPGILGISSREFTHHVANSAEGLRSRRECCWGATYLSLRIFV